MMNCPYLQHGHLHSVIHSPERTNGRTYTFLTTLIVIYRTKGSAQCCGVVSVWGRLVDYFLFILLCILLSYSRVYQCYGSSTEFVPVWAVSW
jgi:hypothetical protein